MLKRSHCASSFEDFGALWSHIEAVNVPDIQRVRLVERYALHAQPAHLIRRAQLSFPRREQTRAKPFVTAVGDSSPRRNV